MKKEYDFSKGKRGAVDKIPPGKTRITIRLDNDVISWFRDQVGASGGGNYQTLINNALKEYIYHRSDSLKEFVQQVVQDEISKSSQGK